MAVWTKAFHNHMHGRMTEFGLEVLHCLVEYLLKLLTQILSVPFQSFFDSTA